MISTLITLALLSGVNPVQGIIKKIEAAHTIVITYKVDRSDIANFPGNVGGTFTLNYQRPDSFSLKSADGAISSIGKDGKVTLTLNKESQTIPLGKGQSITSFLPPFQAILDNKGKSWKFDPSHTTENIAAYTQTISDSLNRRVEYTVGKNGELTKYSQIHIPSSGKELIETATIISMSIQ